MNVHRTGITESSEDIFPKIPKAVDEVPASVIGYLNNHISFHFIIPNDHAHLLRGTRELCIWESRRTSAVRCSAWLGGAVAGHSLFLLLAAALPQSPRHPKIDEDKQRNPDHRRDRHGIGKDRSSIRQTREQLNRTG